MNWTSPGAGTTPHLAGEVIKQRLGIEMQHIPFAGAGPATNAVIAGQVDLYTANLGSLVGHIEGGKMRPLAMTSKQRWPGYPNVPTLEEAGIKDAESDTFQAVFAPGGTPKPIVDRLAKELAAILARPDIKEKFAMIGLPVVAEGPTRSAAELPRRCQCTRKSSTRPA
jgi:tripartite-type tricarboxylate transporter receptor subunit TctC